MMWGWLAGKAWWLVAAAVVIAILAGQQARVSNANSRASKSQTELAEYKANIESLRAAAENAAREEEARRNAEVDKVVQEALDAKERAQNDLANANVASGKLRERIAALVASGQRSKDPKTAGPGKGEQDSDPIGVLAIMSTRLNDFAGAVAKHADEVKAAAIACERYADGLQKP